MEDTFQSPGEQLKQARESKNLSERDAANKLHLSASYLRALEADDFDHLPEATFIKGYIRNYARLLDLPAEELVAAFESMRPPEQIPADSLQSIRPTREMKQRVASAVILLIIVIVALLAWWLMTPNAKQGTAADQVTGEVTRTENTQALASGDITDVVKSDTKVSGETTSDESPADTAAPAATAAADKPSQQSAAAVAEKKTPAAATNAKLTLTFSHNCWVEVADASGKSLYSGTQHAGGELTLQGKAPFQLMLGNAGGVTSVSVNGETVALPESDPGDVLKIQVP